MFDYLGLFGASSIPARSKLDLEGSLSRLQSIKSVQQSKRNFPRCRVRHCLLGCLYRAPDVINRDTRLVREFKFHRGGLPCNLALNN
jgi:hypothetical protein